VPPALYAELTPWYHLVGVILGRIDEVIPRRQLSVERGRHDAQSIAPSRARARQPDQAVRFGRERGCADTRGGAISERLPMPFSP